MEALGGFRVNREQPELRADGYVKEFTRHSDDVLLNLNELRHRNVLTDAALVVGNVQLRAHCAVLVACSGFFYSLYSRRVVLQGRGGAGGVGVGGENLMTVSLPNTLDPSSISLLLDFMYTSRLPLTPTLVPEVLAAAAYLQMDHVAETCRDFMRLHCRENVGARHLRLELDSSVSVASVGLKGADLHHPGPRGETIGFPEAGGGSLKRGAFPSCRPGSKEPESPRVDTPTLSPDSPARSSCQPNSPAESNTCSKNLVSETKVDPKACNWKKYKYIVLNPLCAAQTVKEEEPEEPPSRASPVADASARTPETPAEAWPGEVPGQIDRQGQASCYEGSGRAPPLGPLPSLDLQKVTPAHKEGNGFSCNLFPKLDPADPESAQHHHHHHHHHHQHQHHPIKRESYFVPYCYSANVQGTKTSGSGDKPYRCNVCGAQFNRPANLKTHSRIHSGEKPYRCDTCGARFVQVAHLRAHVLIHTGEKPYPCHTCGTRFRHLQTLKSHLRIHTGEKPYTCEKCDLHFRHKSQLRLHLRQKHGAVTNTKVRYKVLTEPYQPLLQAC